MGRKNKHLSLEDRYEISNRLNNNLSFKAIAKKYTKKMVLLFLKKLRDVF